MIDKMNERLQNVFVFLCVTGLIMCAAGHVVFLFLGIAK